MSRQDFYHSKEWRQTARYVWIKQYCLCARCHRPVYVDGISAYLPKEKRLVGVVHHIKHLNETNYNDENISLNEDNLEGLCQDCHALVHGSKVTRNDVKFDANGNLIPVATPHT